VFGDDDSITVTAEIENKIYKLQSPQMLDPGDYPASMDKGIVRLQVKDKKGKEKTIKLHVVSVAAKQ
jgi:competence protein ComGF